MFSGTMDFLGGFAGGLGNALQGNLNTSNAIRYNDVANRYALNNQLEALDKASPVVTAAYKQKRMVDSQVDRLNSFKDIALMPRDYKYWN